jgi:pyruvate dehydrogenase E2 component (dihydrolipoamide acetyltransferase)
MREIEVPMPKLSMTMEEGELIAWVKQEGDQVRAGDVIAEVNSDKVEMEVESPADGTLVRHTATEGDVVPVGTPIATLATEAEELLGGLFGPADGDGSAASGDGATTAEAAADEEKTAAETETAGAVGATPAAPAAARTTVVPGGAR